jgi:hypothetical protein
MRACSAVGPVAVLALGSAFAAGCGGDKTPGGGGGTGGRGGGPGPITLPAATCAPAAGGGSAEAAAPAMKLALKKGDGGDEGWLGSPAVADLDGDGAREIVAARGADVVVWNADGSQRGKLRLTGGRIWSAPLVGDFVGDAKLEIAAACRAQLALLDASLQMAPGFPVTWRDEMRSLAAGDVDGDGRLELVPGTMNDLDANNQTDIFHVFRADGTPQPGFPANTSGTSGCDANCFTHAGFDQNVAVGPIDQQGGDDIFLPQDNAYISVHQGTGVAFDAASIFRNRRKVLGVRFMHDYAEAQQGFGDDEDTALQAHFTNSPGTIADIDGDGEVELVMVGSVQNAAQTNRELGVALWVIHRDGTRPPAWTEPFHVPAYLAGLDDLGGNIVALTNQVAAADIDPAVAGLELVFAGFDGRIHAVTADRTERWSYAYTTDATVLTGGVAIADLSGDGAPEIVFASYSTGAGKSALHVLDAGGNERHKLPLPGRGAMSVPTVADVDGDGGLEILVSLKDGDSAGGSVLVFGVPGSAPNCLPWPTGRANLLRSGFIRR